MLKPRNRERRELSPEEEARGKIRDWLFDPQLKFHASSINNLVGIAEKGILSQEFADEIQQRTQTTYDLHECGGDVDRYISISDREKNPDDPNHHANELWLKNFIMEGLSPIIASFGVLLPSDLVVVDESEREITTRSVVHNESLVDVRIRPQKFDGLILVDNPELFETIGNSRAMSDIFVKNPYSIFCMSFFSQVDEKTGRSIVPSPEEAKEKIRDYFGKDPEEVRVVDVFQHIAEKLRIPLYLITHDKGVSTKVEWPK